MIVLFRFLVNFHPQTTNYPIAVSTMTEMCRFLTTPVVLLVRPVFRPPEGTTTIRLSSISHSSTVFMSFFPLPQDTTIIDNPHSYVPFFRSFFNPLVWNYYTKPSIIPIATSRFLALFSTPWCGFITLNRQ